MRRVAGMKAESIFRALAEAGLFRLYLPKALSEGRRFSPFEFMTIVEASAALDGSVPAGWSETAPA